MPANFGKRFKELLEQADHIEMAKKPYVSAYSSNEFQIDDNEFLGWKVKTHHLLVAACGEKSQHVDAFRVNEGVQMYSTEHASFRRLVAVLGAAQEDYEGGYLNTVRHLVQAEVFDNELDQADELYKSGYFAPAAVVARVVLETGIRQLCSDNGVPHGKLNKMNDDLVKAGGYTSLTQKQIVSYAAVGNAAAHGKTNEFSGTDVSQMIQGVRSFLAAHLT